MMSEHQTFDSIEWLEFLACIRPGTCNESSNDANDEDSYKQDDMSGLRIHDGVGTASQDMINARNGIVDAQGKGDDCNYNGAKENCRVFHWENSFFL